VPSASVAGAGVPEQPGFDDPVVPVEPVGLVGPVDGPRLPVGDVGAVAVGLEKPPGTAIAGKPVTDAGEAAHPHAFRFEERASHLD